MENTIIQYSDLTVEEFADKASEINRQALAIKADDLTVENVKPEELETIQNFLAVKGFLNETAKAQEFLVASTQEFSDGKEIKLLSVMPSQKYKEAVQVLTNNMDKDFVALCTVNSLEEKEYVKTVERRMAHLENSNRDYYALESVQKSVTVGLIQKMIEEMHREQERIAEEEKAAMEKQTMEQKYIEEKQYEEKKRQEEEHKDEPTVEEATITAMSAMAVSGALYEISSMEISEISQFADKNNDYMLKETVKTAKKATAEKPSIVVTGGGYAVMPYVEQGMENTTAIEALLEADITADGEYVPATLNPQETTNDMSKVGGNIQAAAPAQLGSIETKIEEAAPAVTNKAGKSVKLDIER